MTSTADRRDSPPLADAIRPSGKAYASAFPRQRECDAAGRRQSNLRPPDCVHQPPRSVMQSAFALLFSGKGQALPCYTVAFFLRMMGNPS